MSNKRPPKKSEVLEVRIAHDAKQALMRKAQAEGRSASAVIRECIARYVADEDQEVRPMLITLWKPAVAAGALGTAVLASTLVPTQASAGPDFRAAFERLDRNRDDRISLAEFAQPNGDMLFVERADAPPMTKGGKPFVLRLGRDAPPPPPGASVPPKEMMQSEFSRHDANGDGSITYAEFEQFHRKFLEEGFAALDGNGDGFLDGGEYQIARSAAPMGAADFTELDADRDGRISQDEFFS